MMLGVGWKGFGYGAIDRRGGYFHGKMTWLGAIQNVERDSIS